MPNYNYYNPTMPTTTGGIQYTPNYGMNVPSYNNPQPPQMQPSNTFVWVQGEEAAKAYPVAPNNSVLLFDSENPVLYIKQADQTGRPMPMQIFDLVSRTTATQVEEVKTAPDLVDYDKIRQIVSEEVNARFNRNNHNRSKKEVEVNG